MQKSTDFTILTSVLHSMKTPLCLSYAMLLVKIGHYIVISCRHNAVLPSEELMPYLYIAYCLSITKDHVVCYCTFNKVKATELKARKNCVQFESTFHILVYFFVILVFQHHICPM